MENQTEYPIKVRKNISAVVDISIEDVADWFCGMNGDQQAKFFNHIAEDVKTWEKPFVFQMQYLTDSPMLNEGGRRIMKEIGEYAYQIAK